MHSLSAFGVASLLLQSYQAIWSRSPVPGHGLQVAGGIAACCVIYGLVRLFPRRPLIRDLQHPRCRVEIISGDLFEQRDAHLVVGFTDVFDTDTTDSRIIHETSVQGQFLRRVYDGDTGQLDKDLDKALAETCSVVAIPRAVKPLGKLHRYPIGTVAVLGMPRRLYFCVAYSTMTPTLMARSSGDDLWLSLSGLWAAVYQNGQRGTLAMPVVGGGLSRLDSFDRVSLVRLILLSFVTASREHLLTHRLRVVLPPHEFEELDHTELRAFLDSL